MNTNKEDFLKVQEIGGNNTPLCGFPVYLHALGLSWLQPKRIANFTLEDIGNLTQNQLLVGSLYASDGSCNHVITVFNRLVFDSNEATSLPLASARHTELPCQHQTESSRVPIHEEGLYFYRPEEEIQDWIFAPAEGTWQVTSSHIGITT